MRNVLLITLALGLSACSTEPTAAPFAGTWVLTAIDGKPLPAQADMPEGYVLEALYLATQSSQRPKGSAAESGTISLLRSFLDPSNTRQQSVQVYPYGVVPLDGRPGFYSVTINLCPVGAPCAAIMHELAGTMDQAGEMVLTEYIRPAAIRTLRFVRQPNLPD